MTAVDLPDNGQDEQPLCSCWPDPQGQWKHMPGPWHGRNGKRTCPLYDGPLSPPPRRAIASGRAGAGEQQREQVARFLVSVAYGPRSDGENWFDHLIPAGQEKFLTHADELLALLGGPQPDGEARQHRMDADCWCQPVQHPSGAWDHQ